MTNHTPSHAFSKLAEFYQNNAMAEELTGLAGSFDRVKIILEGAPAFEIPGDEAPEILKEMTGVILYHHPVFAYYPNKFTAGTNPPACASYDGLTGEGNPGGYCNRCPLNQFGSGVNGSKACKNRRRLFVLREGEIFPLLLTLPTGSLREFTRYIKRLLSRGKPSSSVITRFMLIKIVNTDGLDCVRVRFISERDLEPDELRLIRKLSENIRVFSRNISFEPDTAAEN